MLDKDNFMQKILMSAGGSYGNNISNRVNKVHSNTYDRALEPFMNFMRDNLTLEGFGDFDTYLHTNYTQYAEEGYHIGFLDGMRFLTSVLTDKPLQVILSQK